MYLFRRSLKLFKIIFKNIFEKLPLCDRQVTVQRYVMLGGGEHAPPYWPLQQHGTPPAFSPPSHSPLLQPQPRPAPVLSQEKALTNIFNILHIKVRVGGEGTRICGKPIGKRETGLKTGLLV